MKWLKRKKPEKKAKPKLGKPRRRAGSIWRRRGVSSVMAAVMIGLVLGGGWWGHSSGALTRAVDGLKWRAIAVSAEVGFRVKEILVVGRKETSQEDLRKTIRLARGAPILAFDLDDAKRRVEALPWVREATVERMLPSTVLLTIEERQPVALWQHKERFHLIDESGAVILRKGLERFSDLLVVVGEGAPDQASDLIETLSTQPELMHLVKAAVWVGGRRWNVRLVGDVDVRLPEKNAGEAWMRLAEYEKAHRVLEKDVQILDLRIPDRLIVRKSPTTKNAQKQKGQET